MGGACSSTKDKKGKEVKANDPKGKKNEKENDKEEEKKEEEKKEKSSSSSSTEEEKKEEEKKDIKPAFEELTVKYILKGEEKYTQKYSTREKIASLFDILYQNENKYSEYDLITSNQVSLKSHLNECIYQIFNESEEIEVNLFYLGLEISNDIRKEYESSSTIIATPLFNIGDDIGLVIYNKFTKKVSGKILNNSRDLTKFNHLSSYCNGRNFLFIAGGESDKGMISETYKKKPTKTTAYSNVSDGNEQNLNYLNDFYSIDLIHYDKIEVLPHLIIRRAWASMIYIPPKYIFIVSGTCNSVEVYDIEKKMINHDSDLNEKRGECSLCCINNSVLYAFCGFAVGENFLSTIEKCNLRNEKRTWSLVNYSTIDDFLFEQCFYACSYFSDNSIVLFGASENDKNTYQNILFDTEDEDNPTISVYQSEIKIRDVIPEKFFQPLSDNTSILFPLTTSECKMYKIDQNMKLIEEKFPDILNEIM